MKADTLDLTAVFGKDIRYVVPLYQRPYVWNMKDHWEPLWNDIQALAEQIEALGSGGGGQPSGLRKAPPPHFLGALVVEQLSTPVGEIEARQVIDGQQRLTTLQLLILAARRVASTRNLERHDRLLGRLVDNNADLVRAPEHAFKVWPTNADRDVFKAVLRSEPLTDFGERTSLKIANAAAYFEKVIAGWLEGASEAEAESKMEALTTALRSHMRVVAIDLDSEDNAQVIFETLNARGTPLLAADLIKNIVFQRALAEGAEPEHLYRDYWAPFDTDLWRREVRQGRFVRPRLDVFMGHWLAMKSGSEVLVHQLFPVFKDFLAANPQGATAVAQELLAAARTFDSFWRFPWDSVEGRFFARQQLLDVSTTLPFLLYVFGIPEDELDGARRASILVALESYLVRRTVCRLTTKGYNRIFLDLLARVRQEPQRADALAINHLRSLTGESQYWPKDDEVARALLDEPLYVKLPRTRVRLVLEALEWALRTEQGEKVKLFETLQIEHVLPQEWKDSWPLGGNEDEQVASLQRDRLKHTLGNLTLLTNKLNPELSNGPWITKRAKIEEHSVLRLNHELLKSAKDGWSETEIHARGRRLTDVFTTIWPGPDSPSWGAPISGLKLGTAQEAPETEETRDLSEAARARTVIAEMSGDGPGRVVAEALLDELLSWPDVHVRVKAEKEGGRAARRLRVHGKNKLLGAFAILYPKKEHVTVIFRLQKHFAEDQPLAEARDVKSRDPYQVRMKVPAVADIPEALELAQEAYDQVSD